ncbi:MAG: amidase, partial [bacterium]|nr:amidase [bacterium]
MNDLCFQSACEIARAVREKEVSALEVVETHLERIEATHSALNAVVTLAADEARAADARQASGDPIGALHGVPVTIKDSIETAGILTTGGTTGLSNHVPERDAPVVTRLREAGAIVLGKTNTPELTLGGESDNLIFGRTSNPYRLDRTPGGSSGGAAAIIAAGGAALDLGSDVGGSIREPAHYCGIAGIKPTSGRVPGTGHIPASYGALDTFAQIGPMARRVEDIELALGIVSGIDWADPSVVPMPLGASASVAIQRLRVATYTDNGLIAPSEEIAGAVTEAAGTLAAAGVEVLSAVPEAISDAVALLPRIRAAEGGAPVRYALDLAGTKNPSSRLSYALDFPVPPPGNVLS